VQKRDEVVGTPRWLRRVVSAALAFAFLAALPAVSRACTREQLALTCSRDQIEPTSYRLVTEAVALSRTRATYDFWDRFDLPMGAPALPSARAAILFAAERAYELDARNQMAHATLAREYLFDGQREMAEAAWHRVLVAGGSVVWTARVPALDPREPVLVAAGTGGLRLYRIPGLRARLDDATGAIWESLAGCGEPGTPTVVLAWPSIRTIEAGKKGLELTLAERLSFPDTRGRTRSRDRLTLVVSDASDIPLVRRVLARYLDPRRPIDSAH
jgi:hypothetical protein